MPAEQIPQCPAGTVLAVTRKRKKRKQLPDPFFFWYQCGPSHIPGSSSVSLSWLILYTRIRNYKEEEEEKKATLEITTTPMIYPKTPNRSRSILTRDLAIPFTRGEGRLRISRAHETRPSWTLLPFPLRAFLFFSFFMFAPLICLRG